MLGNARAKGTLCSVPVHQTRVSIRWVNHCGAVVAGEPCTNKPKPVDWHFLNLPSSIVHIRCSHATILTVWSHRGR